LFNSAIYSVLFFMFVRKGLNVVISARLRVLLCLNTLLQLALGLSVFLGNLSALTSATPSTINPILSSFSLLLLPLLLSGLQILRKS
jgi:hypothetical protein